MLKKIILPIGFAVLASPVFLNGNIINTIPLTNPIEERIDDEKESIRNGTIKQLRVENTSASEQLSEGVLKFTSASKNEVNVTVDIHNPGPINPYKFSYDYQILFEQSGWSVSIDAVMDPMDFYLDESLTLQYEGDDLEFPYEAKEGMELAETNGRFVIASQTAKLEMAYEVRSFDRKVLDKKTISYNGQDHEVFLVASTLEVTKKLNARTTSQKMEELVTWVSPDLGIINIERNVNEAEGRQFQKQNKISQITVK